MKVVVQVTLSLVESDESEPVLGEISLLINLSATTKQLETPPPQISSEKTSVTNEVSPFLTSTSSMVNEFKSGGMVSTMKLALSGALACETFDSEAMLSARSVIMPLFKEKLILDLWRQK